MTDIAIRVEELSKRYRIGGKQEQYKTMRDTLAAAAGAPFRAIRSGLQRRGNPSSAADNIIWALREVSFEINQGEVVGIIGRNGAGKSTLLKILSRITEPTGGYATIHGRVGSLLEVGSGFHNELTGRENTFLNGAILGMRRAEVERKFDEIVAFSEVEKFIDTPVKHYSSGMYLRLAFAVAAHLEPEILLVDEVLAVGDASFQRKCLNKMQEVGQEGRTVFFVSHNMPAITRLCPRTILLNAGGVMRDGPSSEVVSSYLQSGVGSTAAREWEDLDTAPGNHVARLRAVRVHTEDGKLADALDIRRPVGIAMEFDVLQDGHVLAPNYHVFNDEGVCVFVASDQDPEWRKRPRPPGRYESTAWVPGNLLSEGTFIITAAIHTLDPLAVHVFERDTVAFQVVDSMDGDSARGDYAGPLPGVMRPMLRWTTEYNSNGAKS